MLENASAARFFPLFLFIHSAFRYNPGMGLPAFAVQRQGFSLMSRVEWAFRYNLLSATGDMIETAKTRNDDTVKF